MYRIIDRDSRVIASAPTMEAAEATKARILWMQGQVIGHIGRTNKRTRGDRRNLPKGLLMGLTIVRENAQSES